MDGVDQYWSTIRTFPTKMYRTPPFLHKEKFAFILCGD